MVGLLLLKSLRNLSDEEVVEFWSESAYAQYFYGEREMRWGTPCDPSELTHFRKRIGKEGAERILASTIELHGESAKEKEVVVDTSSGEEELILPDGYETGGQDCARGSETGEQAWSQIAPEFRAHGAETFGGTTRAPH